MNNFSKKLEILFPKSFPNQKIFKNIRDNNGTIIIPELSLPILEIKEVVYHSEALTMAERLEGLQYLIEKNVESLVLQSKIPLCHLVGMSQFNQEAKSQIEKISQSNRFRLHIKVPQSSIPCPVLSASVYDTETNRFYIRFSCAPDINSALHRSLVEFMNVWDPKTDYISPQDYELLFVPMVPYEIVNHIENQLELHSPRVGFYPEYIHSIPSIDLTDGFSTCPGSLKESVEFLLSYLENYGANCYIGEPSDSYPGYQILIPEFFNHFKISNSDVGRVHEVYQIATEQIFPSIQTISLHSISDLQYFNMKAKACDDSSFLGYLSQLFMRRGIEFEGINTTPLAIFFYFLALELHLNLTEAALDTVNILLLAPESLSTEVEAVLSNLHLYLSFLTNCNSASESLEQVSPFLTEDELDTIQSIIAFPGMLLA